MILLNYSAPYYSLQTYYKVVLTAGIKCKKASPQSDPTASPMKRAKKSFLAEVPVQGIMISPRREHKLMIITAIKPKPYSEKQRSKKKR